MTLSGFVLRQPSSRGVESEIASLRIIYLNYSSILGIYLNFIDSDKNKMRIITVLVTLFVCFFALLPGCQKYLALGV